MDKLNEKAAAISGAITGAVLHVLFGLFIWTTPGMMTGAYGNMYYGMMRFSNPTFEFGGWIVSIILGLIVGAFVGWLIAVSYNWGLKKK